MSFFDEAIKALGEKAEIPLKSLAKELAKEGADHYLQLRAERDRYRAALEIFADGTRWFQKPSQRDDIHEIWVWNDVLNPRQIAEDALNP